jgi:hypothetical protein
LDTTVEFTTCDELIAAILKHSTTDLIYRGQRTFKWPLACTVSRCLRDQARAGGPIPLELMDSMVVDQGWSEHVRRTEDRLLRDFMTETADLEISGLPDTYDRLGWWELMQHHQAPTRLLDWTRSPFIGLWFAYWRHADGDAALWIFDARNSWINHLDSMAGIEPSGWKGFLDDRRWQNRVAEAAVAKRSMVPLVVNPRVAVPRVVAQQSILTLIPNVDSPQSLGHFVLSKLATSIRLKAAWKSEIVRLCESLGLNEVSLFRDLDSVGRALTEKLSMNLALISDTPAAPSEGR